jgi:dihydrodipicolinate synthase/N-acetylneuraminate lyase
MKIEGVWLPIVTPFLHDQIDFASYKNLIDHYLKKGIAGIIPLLFEEPNPAPIKYCLKKLGLIQSAETRLPLMDITKELEKKLDAVL